MPPIDVNTDVDKTDPPRQYPTPETLEGLRALEQFRTRVAALRERIDPISIGRELLAILTIYIVAFPETGWGKKSPNNRGSMVEPFHVAAAAELRVSETTVRNYMWLAEGLTPDEEALIPDELRKATSYLLPLVKEHDPEVRKLLWKDLERGVPEYKARVRWLREVDRAEARERKGHVTKTNEAVLRAGDERRFLNRRDGVDFTLEVVEVSEYSVRIRWHADTYTTQEIPTGEQHDWSDVLEGLEGDDLIDRSLEHLRDAMKDADVREYLRTLPPIWEDDRPLVDAPAILRPFATVGNLRAYVPVVADEPRQPDALDDL